MEVSLTKNNELFAVAVGKIHQLFVKTFAGREAIKRLLKTRYIFM